MVEQVPFDPVNVYVVVEVGVATGLEIVALLKPVEGVQLYVVAPLEVKLKDDPAQIFPPEPTVKFGDALTLIVMFEVEEHPFEIPVTVYV